MAYRLYMALVAYYTGFFNTPKSLQLELNLSRSRLSSEQQHGLAKCFKTIIDHRLDFCKANLARILASLGWLTLFQTRCSSRLGTNSKAFSLKLSPRTSSGDS